MVGASRAPTLIKRHGLGDGRLDDETLCGWIDAVASRQDRGAFAELFQYFAPRLKSFAMRSGTDPETAEELAQDAMISVWRRASTFDRSKASVSTWIFTIARNRRIDVLRRETRPEIDPNDPWFRQGEERDIEETVAVGEYGEMIRKSIHDLPEEQSEVLHKAYFEDKSHRAIADDLGLPLGTVKSRIRLALERLRVDISEVEQ